MKSSLFILMCLLPVFACRGAVIIVDANGSSDFSKIQDAIKHDDYSPGDTILVKPGTYYENNISFMGRALVVTSEDPNDPNVVENTIISAASGYSVQFASDEGRDSVLTGFTIIGRGIYCYGTSPTISKNVIRDCQNRGIYGVESVGAAATPDISGNTIIDGDRHGIDDCQGPITGNIISGNGEGGLDSCDGTITNNIISNNSNNYGGGLRYCGGEITGNVISNNYAFFDGGGLYGCSGPVSGNIIIENEAHYDGGGLFYCEGSISHNIIAGNKSFDGGGIMDSGGAIYNNTIVGNRASGRGGAIFGPRGVVRNNIIAFNEADNVGGIYGLCNGACGNSYNLFWNDGGDFGGDVAKGPNDITGQSPRFATNGYWDTNDTPGDQSDDFWVDGDYHVKSEYGRWDPCNLLWVTDDKSSAAIDGGDPNDPNSDWRAELWPHGRCVNIGVYGGTAHASMSPNDVGNIADLDHDNVVIFKDLMLFTDWWGSKEGPLAADLDRVGGVNFPDYCIFAANWLAGLLPPIPDPLTWATEPDATSPDTIAMEATTAASNDDSGIEYMFWNTTLDVKSPWQDNPAWEDTGLDHSIEYSYRVKARNKGNLQETEWSEPASATIPAPQPPEPNPMTWKTVPYATSPYSIAMEATTATATYGSDVKYWFWNTTTDANSGWVDSPVWEDTGLSHSTTYSYRVKALDVNNGLDTAWSNPPVSAKTPPPESDPPIPLKMAFQDDVEIDGIPCKYDRDPFNSETLDWNVRMTAVEATDSSGGVEYFFQCTNSGGFSSGWQSERTYDRPIGGQHVDVWFKIRARDIYGNETDWSDTIRAMVCE